MTRIRTALRQLVVVPIRAYRIVVSPLLPPTCRFYPSCSAYALDAIVMHGVVRGVWLSARRLLRCHPWSEAAVDHVPAAGR